MLMVVPCDVCIKRFYRAYVRVDENASREEIREAMIEAILENQDEELTDDPDLEIEDHDILFVKPDEASAWSDEEGV